MFFNFDTSERSERPEDWVPEASACDKGNNDTCEVLQVGQNSDEDIVDIFSVHASNANGTTF